MPRPDAAAVRAAMEGLSEPDKHKLLDAIEAQMAKPVISDEQIQADVQGQPSQQSGGLETLIGGALLGPPGMAMAGAAPGIMQKLGRGAEDASARMVTNVADLVGAQPDERAAEIKAQLQPKGAVEAIGQLAPTVALAAAGGPVGAGIGATADTGSLVAGGLSAATAGLGTALSKPMTPAIKWAATQTIAGLLRKGGLGAIVGGYEGGVKGAVTGAATQALLGQLGVTVDPNKAGQIAGAVKKGADSAIARLLWSILPPTIAHGTEVSYDSADRTLKADSPAALAEIARKRRDAMQVLR